MKIRARMACVVMSDQLLADRNGGKLIRDKVKEGDNHTLEFSHK